MIRARFEEYAARYDMLPEGSRVLCACSGGADSTALLHLLCHTPGLTVAAAHYNHALRGADADRDERFVRELCRRLARGEGSDGGLCRERSGRARARPYELDTSP